MATKKSDSVLSVLQNTHKRKKSGKALLNQTVTWNYV